MKNQSNAIILHKIKNGEKVTTNEVKKFISAIVLFIKENYTNVSQKIGRQTLFHASIVFDGSLSDDHEKKIIQMIGYEIKIWYSHTSERTHIFI